MSFRNCVKCFQFTLLLFLVGCGNSLAKSEHTAHQTSIQTDRFAVGQILPQPVTTTLNYETLVDKTAGKVSGKAYRKYQDRFEDYLQARRTGLRGKLFEAAVAYQANQYLEQAGKPERVLTTAAEGDPAHPADNLLWNNGKITKSFQLKSTRNRKSITQFLTEKEYTTKYDDEIIVVHPETLQDIQETLRRVTLRGKSLSADQQIVEMALKQGRLTDELIPGLKVPTLEEVQREADEVIARQFAQAKQRFGTSTITPRVAYAATTGTASGSDDQTVYITNSGKKYHRDGCQYLRKSKHAISLSEARKTHSPCKRCKPSP